MAGILGVLSRATTSFIEHAPIAIAKETKLLIPIQEGCVHNRIFSRSITDGYRSDETRRLLFLSRGEVPCNFSSIQLDHQMLFQKHTNCLFLSRINTRTYTPINNNFLPVVQKRYYGDTPLGKVSIEAHTGDIGKTETSQTQTMTSSPGSLQSNHTSNNYYFGTAGLVLGFAIGYLTHWAQCCRDHEEGDFCARGKEFLGIKKK